MGRAAAGICSDVNGVLHPYAALAHENVTSGSLFDAAYTGWEKSSPVAPAKNDVSVLSRYGLSRAVAAASTFCGVSGSALFHGRCA